MKKKKQVRINFPQDKEMIYGSSFAGYLDCDYQTLVRTFGEPVEYDNYKVDAHWILKFNDGTVATIYNYKDGVNYLGEKEGTPVQKITDWHVGGFRADVTNLVRSCIKTDRINLQKFWLGGAYYGYRSKALSDGWKGVLVEAYVTLNHSADFGRTYRNPAYVLLCEDGKRRSYQFISKKPRS